MRKITKLAWTLFGLCGTVVIVLIAVTVATQPSSADIMACEFGGQAQACKHLTDILHFKVIAVSAMFFVGLLGLAFLIWAIVATATGGRMAPPQYPPPVYYAPPPSYPPPPYPPSYAPPFPGQQSPYAQPSVPPPQPPPAPGTTP